MRCFNCFDTVYMEDMGDGDWKCPVCGDEYNEFADYDLYADPEPIGPFCFHRMQMYRTETLSTTFIEHRRCLYCGFEDSQVFKQPMHISKPRRKGL